VAERTNALKLNVDFFCSYSPKRINSGDKVNTLTTIKKITSGSTPEGVDSVPRSATPSSKGVTWKVGSTMIYNIRN
jgi:UDP-N-acetyl-D-galactosamine dehydrogenase